MLTRLSKRCIAIQQTVYAFSSLKRTISASGQKNQHEYVYDNRMFNNFQKNPDTNVYTILLNQAFDKKMLEGFLSMSEFFITADGASNRLYDKAHTLLDKYTK